MAALDRGTAEARDRDAHAVETVRVDHDVDRRRVQLGGQPLQEEDLRPHPGVIELGLVPCGDHHPVGVGPDDVDAQPLAVSDRFRDRLFARLAPQSVVGHAEQLELPRPHRRAVGLRELSPLLAGWPQQEFAVSCRQSRFRVDHVVCRLRPR